MCVPGRSPPLMDLLRLLKPALWFAAHLHVKFAAVVPHFDAPAAPASEKPSCAAAATSSAILASTATAEAASALCLPTGTGCTTTRFLALDKCLPGRYVRKRRRTEEGPARVWCQRPCLASPPHAVVPHLLCLASPFSDFLQIVRVPVPAGAAGAPAAAPAPALVPGAGAARAPPALEYDPEWLAILRRTHGLLSTSRVQQNEVFYI